MNNKEHFEAMCEWAGTTSERVGLLGSGTRGEAFRFGDKVLKITNDMQEANNCALIKRHPHPNLYTIHQVAKHKPSDLYCIVYDYVDHPSIKLVRLASAINRSGMCQNAIKEKRYSRREIVKLASEAASDLEPYTASGRGDELIGFEVVDDEGDASILQAIIEGSVDRRRTMEIASAEAWIETLENIEDYDQQIEWFVELNAGMLHLVELDIDYDDLYPGNVGMSRGHAVIIDVGFAVSADREPIDVFEQQSYDCR